LLARENIRKHTPGIDIPDQTMRFDHVVHHQLGLSPVLPVKPGRNAQASRRWLTVNIMRDQKPIAAPYILAAFLVAVAVWSTMGSPQADLGAARHRHAGPP